MRSMRAATPDAACAVIADGQLGLLTRSQIRSIGLSDQAIRRRVAAGVLIHVLPSVYRIAGASTSWDQRALAACLWSEGFVSHCCSAALRGWENCPRGTIEVVTTRNLRSRKGLVVHRRGSIPAFERDSIRGIPATSAPRTLIDLATSLEDDDVELVLEDVLRRNDATLARLRWELKGPLHGVGGAAIVRKLVEARPPGYKIKRSGLEVKLARFLARAGMPEPAYEFEIVTAEGIRLHPDFSYPDRKVAIECESYKYHGGRAAWLRDIERYAMLRRMGWYVIQVTEETLKHDAAGFLAELKWALKRPLA